MALPKAVQAQSDAADAALDEAQRIQDAATAETVPLSEAVQPVEQTPVEQPPAPEAQAPEPEEHSPTAAEIAEQRYKTLQGKYNAEVKRFQAALADMQSRMQAMEEARTAAPAPAALDPQVLESAHKTHLSENEVKEYGEDSLKLQARVARGVAEAIVTARLAPLVSDLSSRISQLENRLLNQAGMTFWQQVDAKYPGAKLINDADEAWDEFLDRVDETSGLTFREIGERAVRTGDVDRCVRLFEVFKPRATAQDGAARSTPAVKPRKASGGSAPSAPREAPKYRESDMTKFYSDVARGAYRGREAERDATERAIMDAVSRGALVPG